MLRYISPVDTGTSFQHRIPHPVFGWVLEPGTSYLNKMPEAAVRVTYNSTGWRDIEHNFINNRGVFRVLVLGDSFMEGYSVELDDMFHKQIEQLAHNEKIDIEVINLGVGGYGTLQEYLVFRDIGQHFKPDIVLLGFYINNDIKNNSLSLETGSASYAELMKMKGIKVSSRPFLDPSDEAAWTITRVDYEGAWRRYSSAKARLAAKVNNNTFIYNLARQSALLQAIRNAVNRIKTAMSNTNHVDSESTGKQPKKKKKRSIPWFGAKNCQEKSQYTTAWFTTKRILERLNNEVSSIGGELFVFTVPALHEVLNEEANRELPCKGDAPVYERLKGILNELEIGNIDLLPSFRKTSRDNRQTLFRLSDRHWSEEGHQLAAELVYTALKNRGLLPLTETDNSAQKQ